MWPSKNQATVGVGFPETLGANTTLSPSSAMTSLGWLVITGLLSVRMCTYVYTCVRMCTCVYVCVHVGAYVYMCVRMCVWVNTEQSVNSYATLHLNPINIM